jgi:uncharacterized protein (DUF305 family)
MTPPAKALVVLVAASAMAACASGNATRPSPAAAPDAAELEALYRARQDSARARFTTADVSFVTGMIAHHAQALDMAELVPQRSTSPALRTLAARIINAQRDEIAWMEMWLRDRAQPVPAPSGADSHTHVHLPGMVTPEQLAGLQNASANAFDRSFLTLMIQHHRGAVAMVLDLLDTDGAAQDPATFKLASDIHVDQTTEIARMEQMLAALPPGDLR